MLNIQFKSSKHIRIEASGEERPAVANRLIEIRPNTTGCDGYNLSRGDGYIVTLYNLDGMHPIWRNNIQMSPKPMRIIHQDTRKIELRGYPVEARTPFGWINFSGQDYGMTVFLDRNHIEKCVLHMHDRNINIEFLL